MKYGIASNAKIPRNFRRSYYGDKDYVAQSVWMSRVNPGNQDHVAIIEEMKKTGYWWRKHFMTHFCVHKDRIDTNFLAQAWDLAFKV